MPNSAACPTIPRRHEDFDRVDRQILAILQGNARTPNADIARRVGVAPSAIFARVRKLEDAGYVGGYEARLAAGRLGLGLVAFVAGRSDEQPGGIELRGHPVGPRDAHDDRARNDQGDGAAADP